MPISKKKKNQDKFQRVLDFKKWSFNWYFGDGVWCSYIHLNRC